MRPDMYFSIYALDYGLELIFLIHSIIQTMAIL